MKHVFAILETPFLNRSFNRYFKHTCAAKYHSRIFPGSLENSITEKSVPAAFDLIADWINSEMIGADLREAIGIIEFYDKNIDNLSLIDPLHLHLQKGALTAMLVLGFPEIHWIFVTPYATKFKTNAQKFSSSGFEALHTLKLREKVTSNQDEKETHERQEKELNLGEILGVHAAPFTSLFDPFGFRQNIRLQIRASDEGKNEEAKYIPYRNEYAVSLDEESDYSFFVGYAAYRFGYCTSQISSYYVMEKFNDYFKGKTLELSFEDMYANFPDKPAKLDDGMGKLSDLEKRHQNSAFQYLGNSKCKIIVTADHNKGNSATHGENTKYINKLTEAQDEFEESGRSADFTKQRGLKVVKPFSGIFDFWKKARQFKNGKPEQAETYKHELKNMLKSDTDGSDSEIGHSAPGRLLKIAECLITRANHHALSPQTVADAITGATLALEAQEYLGHRTPTVSFHALSLKHKLEVAAECMFYGVGYNFVLEPRFNEIDRHTESIGNWLSSKEGEKPILDAEIKIVNEIGLIYQERGLFDEERQCLAQIRDLYRKLKFLMDKPVLRSAKYKDRVNFASHLRYALNSVLRHVKYGIRVYSNWLLKSFSNFIIAITIWWTFFGASFFVLDYYYKQPPNETSCQLASASKSPTDESSANSPRKVVLTVECDGAKKHEKNIHKSLFHAVNDATVTVFSLQPPRDIDEHLEQREELILSLFGVIISYFHLGIFISFIYSLVVRKQ